MMQYIYYILRIKKDLFYNCYFNLILQKIRWIIFYNLLFIKNNTINVIYLLFIFIYYYYHMFYFIIL